MSTKPIILTLISEKELPAPEGKPSWVGSFFQDDPRVVYLKHFSAVNVKLGAYDRGFGKVLDQAGCARHAWEYLEMRTPEQAEALARTLAARGTKHKVVVFNANAEA